MSLAQETVPLGKSGIHIPPLGIGTWAWGDRLFWGYGRSHTEADVQAAFQTSLEAGVKFFDTAESYGGGQSERLLGKFIRAAGEKPLLATKFMPYPWRLSRRSLLRALQTSLKRLGLESVDLYQIHWPFPPIPIETRAEGLADTVQAGLARAVGVSNFNEGQMRRAYATLSRRGIPLASNQVEYSLANRKAELNGLLMACQELGVTLIAYSPLGMGALTGKYSPEKPPPGIRGRLYNRARLDRMQPLIRLMREIGQDHGGKSTTQVALNWVICKGSVPIPGAKNARQASEIAGALGWSLTGGEVAALDRESEKA